MEINYIGINQLNNLISIGKTDGFVIKDVNNRILIKDKKKRNIKLIELYYKSNIIFLIEENEKVLKIWDEYTKKYINEIVMNDIIDKVKITKNEIIILCMKKLYIYDFNNLQNIKILNLDNNKVDINDNYIVYDKRDGYVESYNLNTKLKNIIKCHQKGMQNIKISNKLKYVVTISENGRKIKIFDLIKNNLIREYFRGITVSKIKYINFDVNDEYLLIYSEKNTLHIYKINEINDVFLNLEYSSYKIKLNIENILCIMREKDMLNIINKDNGEIIKYKYSNYEI